MRRPGGAEGSFDIRPRYPLGAAGTRHGAAAAEEPGVSTAPPRPLLLVVAHGVGEPELASLDAASLDLPAPAPLPLPPDPVAVLRHAGDATESLHDLGVAVDRTALLLRPAGRTDATVVARLGERATGPAPVTLLEFAGVLEAAAIGGAAAARRATTQLQDLLVTCRERLRRGDAPETWLVGLGSPTPVGTTFDFLRTWRERAVARLENELSVRVRAGVVTIDAANCRALDLAAAHLARPPFAALGTPILAGPGRLRFHANHGVAFGERRLAARAPNHRATTGIVAAPASRSRVAGDDPFATLLARFWLRAAELQPSEVDAGSPAPTAIGATPRPAADRTVLASSPN